MSYETAAAIANLDTLLDALMDFAAANGFTKLATLTGTGRQTDMYRLQKGSMYWWFVGFSSTDPDYGTYGRIESRMMTTLPSVANRETAGLGQRELTHTFLYDKPDGTYDNYFFYADSDAIHCVVEVDATIYTHLSFGIINKMGTWTGGEYLSGSSTEIAIGYSPSSGFSWVDGVIVPVFGGSNSANENTGYLYYPYESHGDQRDWSAFHHADVLTEGRRTKVPIAITDGRTAVYTLFNSSPNTFNERAMMIPLYLHVYDNRSGGSLRYIPAGDIPNARFINMTNISPQAVVNTDWDVFPIFQKSGNQFDAPQSGAFGVAYRRIT